MQAFDDCARVAELGYPHRLEFPPELLEPGEENYESLFKEIKQLCLARSTFAY
jgi:hypothetical protein